MSTEYLSKFLNLAEAFTMLLVYNIVVLLVIVKLKEIYFYNSIFTFYRTKDYVFSNRFSEQQLKKNNIMRISHRWSCKIQSASILINIK